MKWHSFWVWRLKTQYHLIWWNDLSFWSLDQSQTIKSTKWNKDFGPWYPAEIRTGLGRFASRGGPGLILHKLHFLKSRKSPYVSSGDLLTRNWKFWSAASGWNLLSLIFSKKVCLSDKFGSDLRTRSWKLRSALEGLRRTLNWKLSSADERICGGLRRRSMKSFRTRNWKLFSAAPRFRTLNWKLFSAIEPLKNTYSCMS